MHLHQTLGTCSLAMMIGLSFGTDDARASAVWTTIEYSTSAAIGTHGLEGANIVSFRGIDAGSVTSPIPTERGGFAFPVPEGHGIRLPLGEFVVTLPQPGTTAEYNNTPFTIHFHVNSVEGTVPGSETKEVVLQGTLNGLVSGSGVGELSAAILAVLDPGPPFLPKFSAGSFRAGELSHILTIPDIVLSLAPSMTRDGRTPVTAVLVSTYPVPEAGTLGVFLTMFAGLAGWRRHKAAKEAKRSNKFNNT